jgi:hypothetical protein
MGAPTIAASGQASLTGQSTSVSFGNQNLASGTVVVVAVARSSAASISTTSVSDSAQTSFVKKTSIFAGASLGMDIYVGVLNKAVNTTYSVAAALSGSAILTIYAAILSPNASIDVIGTPNSGQSTSPNDQAIVNNAPDLSLFFVIADSGGGALSPGNNSTVFYSPNSAYLPGLFQSSLNGNTIETATLAIGVNWGAVACTFFTQSSGGGGGPPPPPPPPPSPPPPSSGTVIIPVPGLVNSGGGIGRVCVTRAIKNARFIASKNSLLTAAANSNPTSPFLGMSGSGFPGFNPSFIIPQTEPAAGYFSIIPQPILNQIEPVNGIGPGFFHTDANGNTVPDVQTGQNFGPLFSGQFIFVNIQFTSGGSTLAVPFTDLQTAMSYYQFALPIQSAYCQSYGPNTVTMNLTPLAFTVSLGTGNSFNDQSFSGVPNSGIQGWVDQIVTQFGLKAGNVCLVFLSPASVSNTDAPPNQVLGYHNISLGTGTAAPTPYVFVNVAGSPLAVLDTPLYYSLALSHETAETIVDPLANLSNPEVCDPCSGNCNVQWLNYFDINSNYLLSILQLGSSPTPPNAAFFTNAVVQPSSSTLCPPPANACAYSPNAPSGPLANFPATTNSVPGISVNDLTSLVGPVNLPAPLTTVQNFNKKLVATPLPGIQVIKMS